jgi:hypothetical protein
VRQDPRLVGTMVDSANNRTTGNDLDEDRLGNYWQVTRVQMRRPFIMQEMEIIFWLLSSATFAFSVRFEQAKGRI